MNNQLQLHYNTDFSGGDSRRSGHHLLVCSQTDSSGCTKPATLHLYGEILLKKVVRVFTQAMCPKFAPAPLPCVKCLSGKSN